MNRSGALQLVRLQPRTLEWVRLLSVSLLLCIPVSGTPAAERVLEGRVIAVLDGDTIDVLVDERPVRVRVSAIDTPERGQPWAARAKQALSARVFGKEVRVIQVTTDIYGRTVGEVYADDVCVGCELVRNGHAWVYRRFTVDAVLIELEAEAREARRGLWSLPESERVPPWDWRRRGKKGREAHRPPVPDGRAFECGAKQTCREMSSCDEARFHLAECGLDWLDGDGDGVPCESVCR
jgi:endonuclease YncB( thermonuclease family)